MPHNHTRGDQTTIKNKTKTQNSHAPTRPSCEVTAHVGRHALAGCVTTNGHIRRSPRLNAPYPAEDLAEVLPGVAAELARVPQL